jgi:hypothetical protein
MQTATKSTAVLKRQRWMRGWKVKYHLYCRSFILVGAKRFEFPTPCSQTGQAAYKNLLKLDQASAFDGKVYSTLCDPY